VAREADILFAIVAEVRQCGPEIPLTDWDVVLDVGFDFSAAEKYSC
jgi:hypothetical protein